MIVDPTRKEWLAARERLLWWYRNRHRNPQTIDDIVKAVRGECPPEPTRDDWRLVGFGFGFPKRVRINPFREEWLAARDRVTALWQLTMVADWDDVVEAAFGCPCPPANSTALTPPPPRSP